MKFADFIIKEAIIHNLASQDRDGAIRELIDALVKAGAVAAGTADELVTAVIKREKSGSTGFGKGVAVPHVKHAKVKKMVATVGRSAAGIDFSALDSQPVYTLVLLLSPEDQPAQHLQAMNVVFTNLQKDTFRRFLRQSAAPSDIADLLDEADQGK